MASHQLATFPFNFITMWIRPGERKNMTCMFCQKYPVAYEIHQYIGVKDLLSGNFDQVWMRAIRQQVNGNYAPSYYQQVCFDCCIEQASTALGKRGPIQQLLAMASLSKKQAGIELSQVIVCTVKSYNDDGNLWAVNAPNTNIKEVAQHINTVEHP